MGISLLLPVRNSSRTLPATLNSLLSQTLYPEEILICIGKSQDTTEEIIREFNQKFHSNSKYPRIFYDSEGLGTGYAMNLLVQKATQDWLLWVASDEILDPNYIYRCKEIIEKNYEYAAILAPVLENRTPKNDDPLHIDITRDSLTPQIQSKKLLNRTIVTAVGNFDPLFKRGQDLDIILRIRDKGYLLGYNPTLAFRHEGYNGRINYKKATQSPTFIQFFWKYGLNLYKKEPPIINGTFLRILFFISSILAPVFTMLNHAYLSIFFQATLLSSIFFIIMGIYKTYGSLTLTRFIFQVIQSFSEIPSIITFLLKKEKPPFKYGVFK